MNGPGQPHQRCPAVGRRGSGRREPFGHPDRHLRRRAAVRRPTRRRSRRSRSTTTGFLDRELSWLHFNQRVLELAEDRELPLLERARFLAIFASNLDEFFMVRVAGLKRRIATGVAVRAASGLMPREVLEQIWASSRELMERHARRLPRRRSCPRSRDEGIELVRWDELTARSRRSASSCSRTGSSRCSPRWPSTRPTRSPTSPGSRSTSPSLVRNPKTGKEHFARVKVPPIFRRFVRARATSASCRSRTSSASTSSSCSRAWRCSSTTPSGSPATRTSRSRRTTPRTSSSRPREGAAAAPLRPAGAARGRGVDRPDVLDLLVRELGVSERRGLPAARPARPARPARHRRPRPRGPEVPRVRARPPTRTSPRSSRPRPVDIFKAPRAPRRPAAPPLRLVLHLGAALHRAGRRRPARAGDQADALPHLRRLPDHRRPHRRRRGRQAGAGDRRDQGALRRAGQHPLGAQARAGRLPRRLRPRRPQDPLQAGAGGAPGARGLRRYSHIGTGNYNPKTARLYEDLGLLTADEAIGEDVAHLFNQLSRLLAATRRTTSCWSRPTRVRSGLVERIDARDRAPPGRPAGADPDQGQLDRRRGAHRRALPRLAGRRAGRALVRGICALRPGVPGLSENIRCARSSAGSSSTAGSSGSTTAASRRRGSAPPT